MHSTRLANEFNSYVENCIKYLDAADVSHDREQYRHMCQAVSQCLEHCDMSEEQRERALALLERKERALVTLYPRNAAFIDGKCVATGCPASLYRRSDEVTYYSGPGVSHRTVWLPSDHYDFPGPIVCVGLTEKEIEQKVKDWQAGN